MPRTVLVLEFILLYVALPLAYRFFAGTGSGAAAVVGGWRAMRAGNYGATRALTVHICGTPVRSPTGWSRFWLSLRWWRFALWLGVRRFAPELQWSFVRQHPGFWTVVMVAYPVLSVYPQGILYRAFFFERYAGLFPGKWAMIVASAAAFAFFAHHFSQLAGVGTYVCRRHSVCGAVCGDGVAGYFLLRARALWMLAVYRGAGTVLLSRNDCDGGHGHAPVR